MFIKILHNKLVFSQNLNSFPYTPSYYKMYIHYFAYRNCLDELYSHIERCKNNQTFSNNQILQRQRLHSSKDNITPEKSHSIAYRDSNQIEDQSSEPQKDNLSSIRKVSRSTYNCDDQNNNIPDSDLQQIRRRDRKFYHK